MNIMAWSNLARIFNIFTSDISFIIFRHRVDVVSQLALSSEIAFLVNLILLGETRLNISYMLPVCAPLALIFSGVSLLLGNISEDNIFTMDISSIIRFRMASSIEIVFSVDLILFGVVIMSIRCKLHVLFHLFAWVTSRVFRFLNNFLGGSIFPAMHSIPWTEVGIALDIIHLGETLFSFYQSLV